MTSVEIVTSIELDPRVIPGRNITELNMVCVIKKYILSYSFMFDKPILVELY